MTSKSSKSEISFNNLDKKEVGTRLKLIRRTLGYKQKDFASALTISSASLSDIESGKNVPRHDVIYNLYTKYNVSIYYLLHGKGEMFQVGKIKNIMESGYYGVHTEFIREFYRYFCGSPLVRYEMMGFLRQFLLEKDKIIEKDILLNEKELAESNKR
jgi:transcriptional regulator with XRE-family HTH domain